MLTPRGVATSTTGGRARPAVAGRLVSLYLLLAYAEAFAESGLAPTVGDACLHQQHDD